MSTKALPARLTWALELLDVKPGDRLLEIGCGRGVAVSAICERLERGRILAIDRSDVMIRAAEASNREAVASGKASFRATALADADFEGARFDKVFAVNVNLFWLEASAELAILRAVLAPRGALYLFYQPPTKEKLRPLGVQLTARLEDNGFRIASTRTATRGSAPLLCVVATKA
ncbi:class I SAM-dependent methyltransferase [Hyalangium gracile]|uniref:class I SAM-dependent methyltransferase n=1 Tax=Hyalangium gracile TaxID=394092 RepID=UPI001CCF0E45|nr:methyltransferase domain-containing protein [Hyalangium gracile]